MVCVSYWDHRKPVRRERAVDIDAAAQAAVDLLDSGGLRALTLRAVANRLEVAPPSLYSRVESVDDLFDLALDRALGCDPELTRTVDEAGIEELVLSYYRHVLRHRWVCHVIAMRAPRGPHYLRLSERLCTLLVDSGVAAPLSAAYALSNFAIGSAATAPVAGSEHHAPVDPASAPTYARLHRRQRHADAERTVREGIAALAAHFGARG
ncbi:transcriptional regulator, TetR family [Prauserella sp. Am3]|nr:transcriptional regulator, TetR family [Prauserella sp. Am3]